MQRLIFSAFDECRRRVVKGRSVKCIVFVQIKRAEFGSAYVRCVRQQGLEYRLQISRG